MKIISILAITTVIVWTAKVIEGDKIPGRVILGMTVLFIMLSGLEAVNAQLAMLFAMLVLVAALLRYGPDIFSKVS